MLSGPGDGDLLLQLEDGDNGPDGGGEREGEGAEQHGAQQGGGAEAGPGAAQLPNLRGQSEI